MGEMYMWKEQVIQDDREESQNYVGKIWEWLTGLCAIDRLQKYSNVGIKCFYVQSYRFIDNKSVKENEERKWNSEIGKIVDPRYIIREIKNERDE